MFDMIAGIVRTEIAWFAANLDVLATAGLVVAIGGTVYALAVRASKGN